MNRPGLAFLLIVGCASSGQRDARAFRAGAYAADVTPQTFPISINGLMTDRQATGVHDPLHARCLVLDDGAVVIAIVVVDSCMIPREIMDEAKALAARATGIPPEHMLISATHTHTAPAAAGVFQTEPDPAYQKYLVRRIAEGITKAHQRLAPAQIGWAVGREPNEVFNRRWLLKPGTVYVDPFGRKKDLVKTNAAYGNPDVDRTAGPIDPEVPILALRSPQGRPIAVLANYSLHYVGDLPALSADYFGAFAVRFAKIADARPEFVAILSNGTSGDIRNDNTVFEKRKWPPGEHTAHVADAVARAAFAAWSTVRWHDHAPLAVRTTEMQLGVRLPDAEELAQAKKTLAAAKGRELADLPEFYARETVLLSTHPRTVRLEIQAMRIGELGIAAIPCEVFVEIGLEIKRRSALKPSFTIELANGYNGYLPTARHHELGGYETWRARSSYLETAAAPKILETVINLLDHLAR